MREGGDPSPNRVRLNRTTGAVAELDYPTLSRTAPLWS